MNRARVAALCLGLAAITGLVFARTLANDFVNCDDDDYIYANPMVTQGLSGKGVAWAFTTNHAFNWHPLTWLSHQLDCQLYGLHPWGHHLTNVLLHTATVVCLFFVLREMTGAVWRSAFVAAVFAVHPLRVESVAWAAERKDVLSGLFFVLTMWAYARYARQSRWNWWYGVALLFFALGLMSKPMLVTLPLVLLLIDFWPLRRKVTFRRMVWEKVLFLLLTVASCATTLWAQTALIRPMPATPLSLRFENVVVASSIYLKQMIWPAGLAVFYPFPRGDFPIWEWALAIVVLAGITIIAWQRLRPQPWLAVGWFWYLIMLAPVIGIVQVGLQSHADRYTYLPQIGIYLAMTWLAAEWISNRAVLGALAAAVIVALMVCSWVQIGHWKNAETLWRHALAVAPENEVADYNLGLVLQEEGKLPEAIDLFQRSLALLPADALALSHLGSAYLQQGKVGDGIAALQKALVFNPGLHDTQFQLANALLTAHRFGQAIPQFQALLPFAPTNAVLRKNLGTALAQSGHMDEALVQFQQAVALDPNDASSQNNLAAALMAKGRLDEAVVCLHKALAINPNFGMARENLARIVKEQQTAHDASAH